MRVEYEAVCLGEIQKANDYLMLDLSNFELCLMTGLIKNINQGYLGENMKAATYVGEGHITYVNFVNYTFNFKTLEGHYTDGIPEWNHYKVTYLGGSRFKFNTQDMYMVGSLSGKYMVFIPGRTAKFDKVNVENPETKTKMFYGFKVIYMQAGMLIVLDTDLAVNLTRKVKLKYINASPGTKEGKCVFKGKEVPKLYGRLKDNSNIDTKKFASWVTQVVRASIVSSLEIDTRDKELKEKTFEALITLDNMIQSTPPTKDNYTLEGEVLDMFYQRDARHSLFRYEDIVGILERVADKNERHKSKLIEKQRAEMAKIMKMTQPVNNLGEYSKALVDGMIDGLSASGFRGTLKKTESLNGRELCEIAIKKRGTEHNIKVNCFKNTLQEYVAELSCEIHPGINYLKTLKLSESEALASNIRHLGLTGVTELASEVHKKIFFGN